MSAIDPEKLAKALAWMENYTSYGAHSEVIYAAASAHLSTLPRVKEVEVEQWGIFNTTNAAIHAIFDTKREAEAAARVCGERYEVIRLTGTGTVRP